MKGITLGVLAVLILMVLTPALGGPALAQDVQTSAQDSQLTTQDRAPVIHGGTVGATDESHARPNNATLYRPITEPWAQALMRKDLAYAVQLLGPPAVPIRHVDLRHSQPIQPGSSLPSDFNCCDWDDWDNPEGGHFTILLQPAATGYSFPEEMAHEVAHLLQPKVFDPFVEGLNNVFAERAVRRDGLDWSGWISFYREGTSPFYDQSYFMMRDIWATVGDGPMRRFLSFAVRNVPARPEKHINIEGWLATLPPHTRVAVVLIIRRYAPAILAGQHSSDMKEMARKSYGAAEGTATPTETELPYLFLMPKAVSQAEDAPLSTEDLRAVLLSNYASMEAALADKDSVGYLAYHASDFSALGLDGRVLYGAGPEDQERTERAMAAQVDPPYFQPRDEITGLTVTGDGTVVTVRSYDAAVHPAPVHTYRDFWVRDGLRWLIRRRREVAKVSVRL